MDPIVVPVTCGIKYLQNKVDWGHEDPLENCILKRSFSLSLFSKKITLYQRFYVWDAVLQKYVRL
jgi:translation initiation factor 2 beta subunit (eIF-2beta)/eIF-5